MIPLEEILDALDLSRAEPGSGFLEALFARFNARVPFENASKILRNAEILEPEARPRGPEVFWADHLAHGTGGTCFARVAAFDTLLGALGFRTRRLLGRVERDDDHAALLVETAAGKSIVDVGFPLPAILPAGAALVASAQGEIQVEPTARGVAVALRDGVPEGPRSLEIFLAPVSEEHFAAHWRETFRPGGRFLREVTLRRDLGHRTVSYARGEVRVDDLHSRLRVPVAKPREAALSELFGIRVEVLGRAFAVLGGAPDPASEGEPGRPASLSAYLATEASADRALAAIASVEGYRRLVAGVAELVREEITPGGFRLTLSAASPDDPDVPAATIVEEVTAGPGSQRVAVVRRQGESAFESSYRAIERGGKTYLLREAVLAGRREDLLRNDSLRGRLAGTLAVDLLAWARML